MRKLLFISVFLFFLCSSIYALDNGYELTSNFAVNQKTPVLSRAVASSNDTNYLAVWEWENETTSEEYLVGRFVNNDGSFASDELSFVPGRFFSIAITSDSTNFFIARTIRTVPGNDDVSGMIVSNDGNVITSPFLVHNVNQDSQLEPAVASNQSNYFVVWTNRTALDEYGDEYDYNIHGQFIDLSGTKIGQELTINTSVAGRQVKPSVASNGDTYFVLWSSIDAGTNTVDLVGRMYDSSGQPLGDTFTIINQSQYGFRTRVASNGDSYVVALAQLKGYNSDDVMIRAFDSSGNAVGSEYFIARAEYNFFLSGNANGFLFCWIHAEEDPLYGPVDIYAQKLDINGFKLGSSFLLEESFTAESLCSGTDQFLFLSTANNKIYGKFLNPMAPSDVVITQQPQAVTGYVGESVTVSVTASSPNGALTYQWYKNHEPIGTSSSSVTISDLDNDDNGALIYCDISDNSGFVRSSAAKLTVLQPAFTISIAGNSILFGGNTAQYTATALYSDGSSYNVSDYVTWSITPGTLGEIDASGRLTVDPVSSFQQVLVQASLYDGYYDETHTGQKTVDINIPFNVTSMSVTPGSVETSAPLEIDIVCSDAVDGSLVNSSTCVLIKAGHDGEFGTGDDSVLPVSAGLLTPAVIRLDLSSLTLPNDDYMVFVSGIKNIHGALLDGEYLDILPSGDNHPGGDFAAEFTISRSVASDIIFNDNDTVTLSWEPFRDGTVYRVDVTDDGTTWAPVGPVEQWPITATTWTGGAWKGYAMRLFRVVGVAPYISMIDPDYGVQDTFSMFVDISGYGMLFPENETQVSFGDGIQVVSVTADGSAQISVEIRISSTAEPGMRDVVVTTPDKVYIKPAAFEVR
ncbi:MAG: hypothetical protein AB1454_02905 [Candidatus Auribacterota bacterium]